MTAKDIALSELHTLKEIIKDVKDIELKALMKEINAAKRIFVGGAGLKFTFDEEFCDAINANWA